MEEGLIIDAIETGNAAFCTRDHAVLLSNFVSCPAKESPASRFTSPRR